MASRMALYDRAVSVVLRGAEDACQKALVKVVNEELGRVKREANPSGTEQYVDGVKDKRIKDIEPFGNALFLFSYWEEIVAFALESVRAVSPVRSGEYKQRHAIYADDELVASPALVGGATRVAIVNTASYARRLEIPSKWWFKNSGKKGAVRGWSVQPQVPQPKDSIYHNAAMTVRRKYGNIVFVKYAWVDAEGGDGGRFPAILMELR